MKLLSRLKNLVSRAEGSAKTKNHFVFPYSNDLTMKRGEIWRNLQNGILLEDTGIFVPWGLPFFELDPIKESRVERADRTEWRLGKRKILDGYEAQLEFRRWKFTGDEKPIKQATENLGQNDEGFERFNFLRDYLAGLLGEPTRTDLQKFGNYDIGVIAWESGDIELSLVGIEKHDLKYTFNIELKTTNAI